MSVLVAFFRLDLLALAPTPDAFLATPAFFAFAEAIPLFLLRGSGLRSIEGGVCPRSVFMTVRTVYAIANLIWSNSRDRSRAWQQDVYVQLP